MDGIIQKVIGRYLTAWHDEYDATLADKLQQELIEKIKEELLHNGYDCERLHVKKLIGDNQE